MNGSTQNNVNNKNHFFFAIGLSYKKADASVRGLFSLDDDQKKSLLREAKRNGIGNLMVISTCNRTELYGFASCPFQLIQMLCNNSNGSIEQFRKYSYIHIGKQAINHMFRVGTGLDSQILGDFEIISQLRLSFNMSKSHGLTDAFSERLINEVIRASKKVKNQTEISSGTTSVSFASVQYILDNVPNVSDKKILLFGTGKIGRNTCDNLVKHIDNKNIYLINRTKEKAEKIAGKFDLVVKDYANLQAEIAQSDIVVVATGANRPTIDKEVLSASNKDILLLDLSIPKNVHENVLELPNVQLVHLDDLSKMTDATLEKRKKQLPNAEAIIQEVQQEFHAWLSNRKFAPTIRAIKDKLQEIKKEEINYQSKKIVGFDETQAEILSDRIIQKITKHFVTHLKDEETVMNESIAVLSKVFQF